MTHLDVTGSEVLPPRFSIVLLVSEKLKCQRFVYNRQIRVHSFVSNRLMKFMISRHKEALISPT